MCSSVQVSLVALAPSYITMGSVSKKKGVKIRTLVLTPDLNPIFSPVISHICSGFKS